MVQTRLIDYQYRYLQSPLGWIEISAFQEELKSVQFVKTNLPPSVVQSDVLKETEQQIKAYFKKSLKKFDLPLNPDGTEFQQSVWNYLLTVDFGKTDSYGSIAKALNKVGAERAVGAANGKNPIAIIIPCHRIIGSDGSMTGYASGLDKKEWLLRHEGVINQQVLF